MCGGEWLLATSATRQAPGSRRLGPGRPVVPGHVADLRSFLRSLSEAFLSLYCPRCREQRGVRETGTRPGGGCGRQDPRERATQHAWACLEIRRAARLPFSVPTQGRPRFALGPRCCGFQGAPAAFPRAPRGGLRREPQVCSRSRARGERETSQLCWFYVSPGARECALRPRDRRTLLTPRGAPGPPGRGSDTSGWTKRGTEPGPGRGR